MKVYVAGKVSGEDRTMCYNKFRNAEKLMESRGFQAVNPIRLVGNWETDWTTAMKICLRALLDCDGIYLLPDWQESAGAVMEYQMAEALGIKIVNKAWESVF